MFFKHPSKLCMTYMSHLYFSLRISMAFFYGGICAIIHGIYPDVLEKSSTKTLLFIQKKISENGCRDEDIETGHSTLDYSIPIKKRKTLNIVTIEDPSFKITKDTQKPSPKDWDLCNISENED